MSAIMIARALGANVIAVDIGDDKLALAREFGARATINASDVDDVANAIRDVSGEGVHVSVDAIGNAAACFNSIDCLRKTVASDGAAALYKGFLPGWMRMAPWSLTFFLSFEQLRKLAGMSSF